MNVLRVIGTFLKDFLVSLLAWVLSLIVDKTFWAAGLALIVFLIKSKYPDFVIDLPLAISVLVLLGIYLASLIKDPGTTTWKKIFSRKLLSYVLSLVAIVLNGFGVMALWGIPLELVYSFLGACGIAIIKFAYEEPPAVG